MGSKNPPGSVIVYQTKKGALELRGDPSGNTIWAAQAQLAEVFEIDQSVISRHVNRIFKDGEVLEEGNMHKMHIAQSTKPVAFYSLDIILAVGYRTNSSKAIAFRQWTNSILKKHLVDGFTVNQKRIQKNYETFLVAVKEVKDLLPNGQEVEARDVLDLVTAFAHTWFSLDAFDREQFPSTGATNKNISIATE